ncbi:hypothetical protein [Methanorbis rubei]|uniref:Uncharacterized protein n=1 Tax=Methanorbis rubei TaxID=3028300 RepID=A0AAE4MIU6_9EURY|nr:hypothetical protein [Methanocorpusculaceae archaeon Cs1]
MKLQRSVAICLIAAFLLLPLFAGAAAAADNDTEDAGPKLILLQNAALTNHYGYITVDSVDVDLSKGVDAVYTINYSIDPWIAFLVFLFGKQDLKSRLLKILNPPASGSGQTQEIVFQYVDNDMAKISVSNVGMSYGDKTYWYPEHEFAVTVPKIEFHSSFTKTFNDTRIIQRGFGYY